MITCPKVKPPQGWDNHRTIDLVACLARALPAASIASKANSPKWT